MTKHLFFILSLGLVLLSCTDDKPYMTIENRDYTFEAMGGAQSVVFETNVDWKAVPSMGWCTVSPTSGSERAKGLIITVAANDTYSERVCKVAFTSCCYVEVVKVTQQGKK